LLELLRFVRDGTAGLANAYPRVVTEDGNEAAKRVMWEVFDRETRAWRGLEEIPGGNLTIASTYDDWNAREQYDIDPDPGPASPLTDQCRCGDIMAGTADPTDCSLFGTVCTPRDLVGPCMVSDEGTCNIWNKYGGHPAV
ncbi:MAG: hydrogenase formation protein HypD, partial [Halodesulfurarchaeum sp.]